MGEARGKTHTQKSTRPDCMRDWRIQKTSTTNQREVRGNALHREIINVRVERSYGRLLSWALLTFYVYEEVRVDVRFESVPESGAYGRASGRE